MASMGTQRGTAGVILIAVGLGLYYLQRAEGISEAAIFFLVGAAFLAGYLWRRVYGLLVPAGILMGLGLGEIGRRSFFRSGDATLIGLGLGFIAIFVVAWLYERSTRWWPLIPGAALLLFGLPEGDRSVRFVLDNWPLVLVGVGVLVLLGAFGRKGSTRRPAKPD